MVKWYALDTVDPEFYSGSNQRHQVISVHTFMVGAQDKRDRERYVLGRKHLTGFINRVCGKKVISS